MVAAGLGRTIPALPCRDVAAAAAYYAVRFAFTVVRQERGSAVVSRDRSTLHLWEADDEDWRSRPPRDEPVRSGAESFLAGTASCRVETEDVDGLWEELREAEVLHPVSASGPTDTMAGTREFAALDLDGNLLAFFVRRH